MNIISHKKFIETVYGILKKNAIILTRLSVSDVGRRLQVSFDVDSMLKIILTIWLRSEPESNYRKAIVEFGGSFWFRSDIDSKFNLKIMENISQITQELVDAFSNCRIDYQLPADFNNYRKYEWEFTTKADKGKENEKHTKD